MSVTNPPEQDMVVVGGGIAGLTAALRATELGMKATVLEQGGDAAYPCNSRFSGGIIHASYRDVTKPADEILASIDEATAGTTNKVLAQTVATDARRLLSWLRGHGVRFMSFSPLEAHRWCMAPPRAIAPGIDWRGRGPDVMLRTLTEHLGAKGGTLALGARATSLRMEDGRCTGVVGTAGGAETVWPARAVVIADGGFQANFDMLRRYVGPAPEKILQRGASNGRGDGIRMALEAGAATTEMSRFYGHLLIREALTDEKLWPYPELDGVATAAIVVDAGGKRWVDEGIGGVAMANAMARLTDPASTVLICDAAIWDGPGKSARFPANPILERFGGELYRANTVEELAAQLGLPAEALAATVAEYNAALKAGRTASLVPGRSIDKIKALPIEKAPFIGIPLCCGITNTTGGLAIDGAGCVLRPDGSAIDGLYAAGTVTGGLEGPGKGDRVGYVGGLVKAVFGLRASEHLAATALHGVA